MSRRILHIIDSLGRTGTAKQQLLLSQALAREGWDVHVAALRGAGRSPVRSIQAEFARAGICVSPLGSRWPADPLAQLRLARHIDRLQPDVIHTWNSTAGLIGAVTSRKRGAPRVVAGQYRIERTRPSWEWSLNKRLAARADEIVTNSPTVGAWLTTHDIPSKKLTIIPSGVALAAAPPRGGAESRDNLLIELGLPRDAKLIGIVGRLIPEKRVKDLIWAADLLRVLHDNLRVLIIGDGPQRQQLTRYARLASDLDHIQFLGERADVDRILPHLDVLWNGSDNTGPSIAILEAMAAGVPVVASDTPSNRELIFEGETGFLIPLGTRAGRAARARGTDRIFTDHALTTLVNAATRERVQTHFALDQYVKQNQAMYNAVIA